MFKMKFYFLFLISTLTLLGCINSKDSFELTDIITEYNKHVTTPPSPEDPKAHLSFLAKRFEFFKKIEDQLGKQLDFKPNTTFDAQEANRIAFNTVITSLPAQNNIINPFFANKLNLMNGATADSLSLSKQLFAGHIYTRLGNAHATLTLLNPSTNVNYLHSQQEKLQTVKRNESFANKAQSIFKNMSKYENELLRHFSTEGLINEQFHKMIFYGPYFNTLNKNTAVLEGGRLLTSTLPLILTIAPQIAQIYNFKYTFKKLGDEEISFIEAARRYFGLIKVALSFYPKYVQIGLGALSAVGIATTFYQIDTIQKNMLRGIFVMHQNLIEVTSFLKEIKRLSKLIKQNPEIREAFPQAQHIIDLFDESKHSKDFIKLIKMLNTNTFTGKPSIFSIQGRVKAAYILLREVKDEFIPALQAIAELDSFTGIAHLMHEQTNDLPFCFAEFDIENLRLEAADFWNPFVSADTAVTNSIDMNNKHNHVVILTGPNTSGKTTTIKSLMIGALLAQTFGIAPARTFVISPFSNLSCFMEINDDITNGISLFKAEVLRAKELNNMVENLEPHQFAFLIMDEVFTSTSPMEGQAAAYSFTNKLAQHNNLLGVVVTHYPKLTELPKENNTISNMHVELIKHQDGRLERTFKLQDGPSFLNVAQDILAQEGVIL